VFLKCLHFLLTQAYPTPNTKIMDHGTQHARKEDIMLIDRHNADEFINNALDFVKLIL